MKKAEVRLDLKKIEDRLIELQSSNFLAGKQTQVQSIIDSISDLSRSLTLGMTPSITGRAPPQKKCNFCGK